MVDKETQNKRKVILLLPPHKVKDWLQNHQSFEMYSVQDCKETISYIKLLEWLERMQGIQASSLINNIQMPQTLVVDHTKGNERKSTYLWADSYQNRLRLRKNKMIASGGSEALQQKIISCFGNISHPNRKCCVVRHMKSPSGGTGSKSPSKIKQKRSTEFGNFEIEFKAASVGDGPPKFMEEHYIPSLVDTNELAEMLKRSDNLGSRFFIQKLNGDFDKNGSEMLRVYNMLLSSEQEGSDNEDEKSGLLGKDAKLMFKVSRSQGEQHHPHNFQNPLSIEDVDPDNMNNLRIDAMKPVDYEKDPRIIQTAGLVQRFSKVLFDIAGGSENKAVKRWLMDLRLDFIIDSQGQPWLMRASSCEYSREFKWETYQSENMGIYLKEIRGEAKAQAYADDPETKAARADEKSNFNRKCGICSISWPANFVENSVTLNVIWDTIESVKNMGLNLGPLQEAANSNHTRPDNFNTRIRVKKICGNCVTLVELTKSSAAIANSMNQSSIVQASKTGTIQNGPAYVKKQSSVVMGASIPTLHDERARTEYLVCRLSLFITDLQVRPSSSTKSTIDEKIDKNKISFKYKVLGSNFQYKPTQAPLNTHYTFAKDVASMRRMVDVYLKEIKSTVYYVNKIGKKLDVGFADFPPVYGAHTADDLNVNTEAQEKQFPTMMTMEIPLDEGHAGTLVVKYACTLENLSFSAQRNVGGKSNDLLNQLTHKEENISWGVPENVKAFPLDVTDTKHFKEWQGMFVAVKYTTPKPVNKGPNASNNRTENNFTKSAKKNADEPQTDSHTFVEPPRLPCVPLPDQLISLIQANQPDFDSVVQQRVKSFAGQNYIKSKAPTFVRPASAKPQSSKGINERNPSSLLTQSYQDPKLGRQRLDRDEPKPIVNQRAKKQRSLSGGKQLTFSSKPMSSVKHKKEKVLYKHMSRQHSEFDSFLKEDVHEARMKIKRPQSGRPNQWNVKATQLQDVIVPRKGDQLGYAHGPKPPSGHRKSQISMKNKPMTIDEKREKGWQQNPDSRYIGEKQMKRSASVKKEHMSCNSSVQVRRSKKRQNQSVWIEDDNRDALDVLADQILLRQLHVQGEEKRRRKGVNDAKSQLSRHSTGISMSQSDAMMSINNRGRGSQRSNGGFKFCTEEEADLPPPVFISNIHRF